jgi:predicted RNA binding protein YcfA (HicA-like mRNA interferase family)
MAAWKKTLQRMLADRDPRNYTYDEAAGVLQRLGFELAPYRDGSHRRWRYRSRDGIVVIIGLVEKGHGTLKPVYIRDMLKQLRDNQLIPNELEQGK